MGKITEQRIAFKPFEYQWAFEAWEKQQNAHWMHTEIPMQSDIKDWELNLTPNEKHAIGNILKGFAQTETHVGNYWSSLIPQWFPVPEVKMMAQTFAAFETIHAVAYSYLNDTLGLDDFAAFLHDEATMNKLARLIDIENQTNLNLHEKARSLAVFSAAAEGIQLYSSFAILLSFRKSNRLKGISQQMIFSIRDESLHSEAGCRLYRTLVQQNPILQTEGHRTEITKAIELSVQAEIGFIDKVFERGDLPTISSSDLKNFIRDRANRKMMELGLEPTYNVNMPQLEAMRWFYEYTSGEIQTDFFANRETQYSKPNPDWHNDDVFDND